MCEKDSDGFIPVFAEKNLELGSLNEAEVRGVTILLIRHEENGPVFAVSNQCPHEGRILTELNGFYLCCQRHGLCFDIRTGVCYGYAPTEKCKLETFDCKVKDGKVWLRL